ncbi:MAG: alpha-xylosidase, partial [Anaerolineaceae bacterium]|nr:alpha-xylosidase [Anaerolineaceae bacterium]
SLLVAPVFSFDGSVDYYLPAGRWTNFLSGAQVSGGRWVREQHGFLSLPLMVRENSVVAVGANDQVPDYDYASGVTFHVFDLADGADLTVRVPALTGETACTARFQRSAGRVEVTLTGSSQPWAVLLRGVTEVKKVDGGEAQSDALGTLITPKRGFSQISIN